MTDEEIVNSVIVIYTFKRPNPKSGEPDCNITVMEKKHFRLIMRSKLAAAKTEEERRQVIDHYKQLFEQN